MGKGLKQESNQKKTRMDSPPQKTHKKMFSVVSNHRNPNSDQKIPFHNHQGSKNFTVYPYLVLAWMWNNKNLNSADSTLYVCINWYKHFGKQFGNI